MKGLTMVTMMGALTAAAATAETVLDEARLDGLLTGNTVYITVPPGGPGGDAGGLAPFWYGGDGSAAVKLPVGTTLVGTWRIEGDHYCADWQNGPQNSCSRLVKDGATIRFFDATSGEPRGAIDHIRPGNPEGL
ncbi:MAG: hypothetical protein AAF366_07150 [Pseudomonadota bacterium]